jgi:hypothetical protein
MKASAEVVYSASSPPYILDSDMSGRLDSDPDFEFFDTNLPQDTSNSPGIFFGEDLAAENSPFVNFNSPPPSAFKSPLPSKAATINTKVPHPLSAPSTASPTGSLDSSSESSGYKRKSSSESSRSALTAGDIMMADEEMADWKVDDMMGELTDVNDPSMGLEPFDGTIDPTSMDNNYHFTDKSMENDFDFESAASSPSPFGTGPVELNSPEMPTIRHDTPRKHSPATKSRFNKNHVKANSVSDLTSETLGPNSNVRFSSTLLHNL